MCLEQGQNHSHAATDASACLQSSSFFPLSALLQVLNRAQDQDPGPQGSLQQLRADQKHLHHCFWSTLLLCVGCPTSEVKDHRFHQQQGTFLDSSPYCIPTQNKVETYFLQQNKQTNTLLNLHSLQSLKSELKHLNFIENILQYKPCNS